MTVQSMFRSFKMFRKFAKDKPVKAGASIKGEYVDLTLRSMMNTENAVEMLFYDENGWIHKERTNLQRIKDWNASEMALFIKAISHWEAHPCGFCCKKMCTGERECIEAWLNAKIENGTPGDVNEYLKRYIRKYGR